MSQLGHDSLHCETIRALYSSTCHYMHASACMSICAYLILTCAEESKLKQAGGLGTGGGAGGPRAGGFKTETW